MMRMALVVVSISAIIVSTGHTNAFHSQDVGVPLCHLDRSRDAKFASANMSIATNSQDPGQDQQNPPPPSHEFSAGDGCSRANPRAEPGTELNGIKKNTVGCVCKRTCVNGQTQEDLSRGADGRYICKNACHRDRCFCPDPCKT